MSLLEDLLSERVLVRERTLEKLSSQLRHGAGDVAQLEDALLSVLREYSTAAHGAASKAWARAHGGLSAAALVMDVGSLEFAAEVLSLLVQPSDGEHPTGLAFDPEHRVREACAKASLGCFKRLGVTHYNEIKTTLMSYVTAQLLKETAEPNGAHATAATSFDTCGHADHPQHTAAPAVQSGQLETALDCIRGAVRGMVEHEAASQAHEHATDYDQAALEIMDVMCAATLHGNRFVKEVSFFAIGECGSLISADAFRSQYASRAASVLREGLCDNWSQVRYAATVSTRMLMDKCGPSSRHEHFPTLLPAMCLNRHYVAEGVRNLSQDTWRHIFPSGAAGHLYAHLTDVVAFYEASMHHPNHAVREAAGYCMSELCTKVIGPRVRGDHPLPPHAVDAVRRVVGSASVGLKDHSWPVREACLRCVEAISGALDMAEMGPVVEDEKGLYSLLISHINDNMPSLRVASADALAAWSSFSEDWRHRLVQHVCDHVLDAEKQRVDPQAMESKQPFLPSGPFAVASSHIDQPAFSCGSLAPKKALGCSACTVERPRHPWEMTEGCLLLLARLLKGGDAATRGEIDACGVRAKVRQLEAVVPAAVLSLLRPAIREVE